MMRFTFKKGLIFIELNTRWTLIRRLVNNKLQFENEEGEIKNLKDSEVLSFWSAGEWQVDINSVGNIGDVIFMTVPADLATYPTKWQETAKRRMEYVNAVGKGESKFNKDKWLTLIELKAKELMDPKPPCSESVYAWAKKYNQTKSITSLLPSRRSGESRKNDDNYSIFEDIIQTYHLSNRKPNGKEIIELNRH